MYRTERDHTAGFALGVISGAVVGAGLALLFAPKSGAALRSNIAESVEPLRSAIAKRYQDLADRAGVEIENLHETVDHATDVLEQRASDAVKTASRKLRSVDPTA
jgi:gas vesicle protein